MNATLVRRILGLILTALLLVGIFVLAATSAAAQGGEIHFHDAGFGNFAEAYRSGFSHGYRDGYGVSGIG